MSAKTKVKPLEAHEATNMSQKEFLLEKSTCVCTEMASASFSTDAISEAIQRKKKRKAEKKIREKLLKGWADVHEEIENMPFCELQDQATKVFLCPKCNSCGITGMCVACNKRKIFHSLLDREEVWHLKASGVKTWY